MIQKKWKYFERIKCKNNKKWTSAFKGYASSYNAEILNSFNPEI